MAIWTYDSALNRLLTHEGGYTNHPADPGGPTNFGITIYDYRKYVLPGASAADIKAMTVDQAKRIYRTKYWDAQRCDDLPAGVDYAVFDYGVNSGIGRSVKVLQRVLGVAADGTVGIETLAAARAADPKKTVDAICAERLRFLQGLRTWSVFGKGWGRRVAEVRSVALAMASSKQPTDARPPEPAQGKAPKEPPPAAVKGTASAGAGAAAAAVLSQSGWPAWQVITLALAVFVATYLAIHFISKRD